MRQDPRTRPARDRIWEAAARLVPPRGAGTFNQALIDLGALVCTPREPGCLRCPLSKLCAACHFGLQDQLPVMTPKPPPMAVTEAAVVVRRRGSVLIVQRGQGTLWAQFWEFPTLHQDGADPAGRSFGKDNGLAQGIRRLTGINARVGEPVHTLRYSVTNYRVKLVVHLAIAQAGILRPGPNLVDARWVDPEALGQYTFGTAGRQLSMWINQGALEPQSPA